MMYESILAPHQVRKENHFQELSSLAGFELQNELTRLSVIHYIQIRYVVFRGEKLYAVMGSLHSWWQATLRTTRISTKLYFFILNFAHEQGEG